MQLLPRIEKAIFGISLRTASFIICWLGVASPLCYSYFVIRDIKRSSEEYVPYYEDEFDGYSTKPAGYYKMSKADRVRYAIELASSSIVFLTSVFLLVGIWKKKIHFINPVIISLCFLITIITGVLFFMAFQYAGIDKTVFQFSVLNGILYYFLIILYNYFKEIEDMKSVNNLGNHLLTSELLMNLDSPRKALADDKNVDDNIIIA